MKETIIVLHGWKLRGGRYEALVKLLQEKGYEVYAPDLPGFGDEPLLSQHMVLDDYVAFVHTFIKEKKISKVILVGHSFGGRVSIKYASKYPADVSKIILTGVPIIRIMTLKQNIARVSAMLGKNFLQVLPLQIQAFMRKCLYYYLGEWDYYKSGELREVFKNIINEDLISLIKTIKVPMLLVWGQDDNITPASDVQKIKLLLPNASYSVVPGVGHRLPYAKPKKFVAAIASFL